MEGGFFEKELDNFRWGVILDMTLKVVDYYFWSRRNQTVDHKGLNVASATFSVPCVEGGLFVCK